METTYTELNERQLRFCENVAQGMKPKDAYAVSGYKVKNPGDAHRSAQRLKERESINEEIERLKAGGESRRTPEKEIASHVETSEKLAEKCGEVDVIGKAMTALTLALEDAKLPAAKRVDAVKQLLNLEQMRVERAKNADRTELLKQFIAECKAERTDAPVCSTCGQPMPDSGTPPATP